MNQPKFLFSVLFVFCLIGAGASVSYGQQVEPSYDVSLQIVIGSNDAAAGRADLPQNFSTISRQLKSTFAFSNYRLAGTFLGRVYTAGSFEYKSLTNIFGQESDPRSQATFLDWSLNNFRTGTGAKGQQGFQAQAFRFGARVPVVTGSFKDDSGKISSVVNYEPIGLTLERVGLPDNIPTLIGTLNLPGAGGTIFLVMTAKSADM